MPKFKYSTLSSTISGILLSDKVHVFKIILHQLCIGDLVPLLYFIRQINVNFSTFSAQNNDICLQLNANI